MNRNEILSKTNEILIVGNKELNNRDLRIIKFVLKEKIRMIEVELLRNKNCS